MLNLFSELIHWFTVLGALVSGGTLLSERLREKKIFIVFCVFWSFVSFIYLFRPLLAPPSELFSSFDRQASLAGAEGNVIKILSQDGPIDVKNFLANFEAQNAGTEFESYALYRESFQMFFNPVTSQFSIILNLVSAKITPDRSVRDIAEFLQTELCLEKSQICGLDYEMFALRTTNFMYPEINGKSLNFNYCMKS